MKAVHFTINPPEKGRFPVLAFAPTFLSVSPDGSKLAFVAVDSTGHSSSGYATSIPTPRSRSLGRTTGLDLSGRRIAASLLLPAGSVLKKVPAAGGPAETMTALLALARERGIAMGLSYFHRSAWSPILRVPSARWFGDSCHCARRIPQQDFHDWPYFLPDGKHFLYFAHSRNPENSGIYVGSLDSKETKLILNAPSSALYSPPGYFLFRAGTLLAQPFDADRLELKVDASPIAEGVQFTSATAGRPSPSPKTACWPIDWSLRTHKPS